MEQIKEIINRNRKRDSLALKSPEPTETLQRQSRSLDEAIQLIEDSGAPKWLRPMMQLAQDRRHDLPDITLRFWKAKFSGIPENLVCEALMSYCGPFFPSVEDILAIINRNGWKPRARGLMVPVRLSKSC
jgi:hypothetical protein